MVSFKSLNPLLIFCLRGPSIIERGMLKAPALIVDPSPFIILFREKLNLFSVSPVATIVPGAAQGWLETPHIVRCAGGAAVKGMWLRGHSGLSWLTRVYISWHELYLPQRVSPSVLHR